MRRWLAVALIAAPVAFGASCRGGRSQPTAARTVAIVTPAGAGEFNAELISGANEQAKLLGWSAVKQYSPPGDSNDEMLANLAITAINAKPDAISVCGMETSTLERVVKRANDARVPIIVHNQITTVAGDVEAYIGYDEFEAGRACGDYALELLSRTTKDRLPAGQVAILDGAPGPHTTQRSAGFREAMRSAANVQVVEEKSAGWEKETADRLTGEWLKSYPGLLLIFACSDNMAIGAEHAVYKVNREGGGRNIQILGIGGTNQALVDVKYGGMAATYAIAPRKMGARIINTMMDVFDGADSVHRGAVIRSDSQLVNMSNLDAFVGGFDATKPPPAVDTSSPH